LFIVQCSHALLSTVAQILCRTATILPFMSVYMTAEADVLSSYALKKTLHPQVRADKRLDGWKMVSSRKKCLYML